MKTPAPLNQPKEPEHASLPHTRQAALDRLAAVLKQAELGMPVAVARGPTLALHRQQCRLDRGGRCLGLFHREQVTAFQQRDPPLGDPVGQGHAHHLTLT